MLTARKVQLCAAAIFSLAIFAAPASGDSPARSAVKGKLSDVEGLRVLRVWGSPHEQGFAEGYLLGEDGAKLLDSYLGAQGEGAVKAYEVASVMMAGRMKILPRFKEEMEGMIEGLRAAHVGPVAVLGRPLEYRDLVAVNCIPETVRIGCSSFAAWGNRTKTGDTIAGRNLDWYANPALKSSQVIVAHLADGDCQGWVSVTWPGFLGCLTGMNADGVTVSVHDAPSQPATDPSELTPRGFALREAIEAAHATSAVNDITKVLRHRTSMVGSNIAVAMPFTGKGAASAVFEYDGVLDNVHGVTVRIGDAKDGATATCQVCTNHYRSRGAPISCDRYERLSEDLSRLNSQKQPIDVAAAWELLRDVAVSGRILTYQSVVFEPNSKLMHVAVSTDGRPAAQCKPVTLDVAALLQVSSLATPSSGR